ncbi:thioredoxin family protein [Qipengyuania sp. JC766]|uniref:protein-disulfide reductase DsbD family protein n=1 Tax=Qipengyuania sp. JC766 TaxID=3232139 RepID=UPI003459F083
MTGASIMARFFILLAMFALAVGHAGAQTAQPQQARFGSENIDVELYADGSPIPGQDWMLALHFTPRSGEWHGYWSNPGDAGKGLALDWNLPDGWEAQEPLYPVPQRLLIAGLMNHIYEGEYTVLVPISVPADAVPGESPGVGVVAQYLACTDEICVPQDAALRLGSGQAKGDPRFAQWRAAIAPALDSEAGYSIAGQRLRLAIPLPSGLRLGDPHLFLATGDLGDGLRPRYAAEQAFLRDGDVLRVELPLQDLGTGGETEGPETVDGILAFGDGTGVRFSAVPRDVVWSGSPLQSQNSPGFIFLILAAIAGGLLLNVMPCVFPILSLKALSLARSGTGAAEARREGLAYSAGVVLACMALGGLMLTLRAAGEQVGWAFQLQEPWVVASLLLLATAITANLAGLFELPSVSLIRSGEPLGAFMTGLLAAVAATPCTGPFMAAALGAALLLPAGQALALFAALGFGLALPFLLVGFVPAVRNRLPKPGPWMNGFRRILAVPMGLTALALAWLGWQVGGPAFGAAALAFAVLAALALAFAGLRQRRTRGTGPVFAGLAAGTLVGVVAVSGLASTESAAAVDSILDAEPFSAAALDEARSSGRPVFVWMTADWCVTCKVNERVAIEREVTREAFAASNVIVLRGDWTRSDPEITRYLGEQGVAGIPFYAWYEAGAARPEQLPQVLTPDALISRAAGDRPRSGGRAAGSD